MPSRFPEAIRRTLVSLAQKTLWSEEGQDRLKYLREERCISDSELLAMQFGYAPHKLKAYFTGNDLPDVSGRIIMPMFDSFGDLLAITTRYVLESDPDYKKKKHWHESFEKNEWLFGLHLAKQEIIVKKAAIIVEGQFDVAYLRSIGLRHVVAALGGSLSPRQVALLSRYCSTVYLFYDGDEGGYKATARAMKLYNDRLYADFGLTFLPVQTPRDKDPDDFDLGQVIRLCKSARELAL